ncbi:MAG: hydrolase 2, exosortase A system-associated [Azonexus sp.]
MTPHILPVGDGFRFCIFHEAQRRPAKGAVLYVHPFAEEMNKSRRMAARQARLLAEAGYCVLQMDLFGSGDSSGGFEEATWDIWLKDVAHAYHHLCALCRAPITFWGMRAGCLLAAQAAAEGVLPVNFIFWQPVLSGKLQWQQFLRLKLAGELASGNSKGVTDEIRASLAAGKPVDIAGYLMAPALADGLEKAELLPPAETKPRVGWIEIPGRPDATLTPAAQKKIRDWEAAGCDVRPMVVHGPAFWQTTEIEDAPELLKVTLDILEAQA